MIKNICSTSNENKIENVLKDNDECWFSSHNAEQSIDIEFEEETTIKSISLDYQKGFECKEGELLLFLNEDSVRLPLKMDNEVNHSVTKLTIKLKKSTDLYNRFCIYRILIRK